MHLKIWIVFIFVFTPSCAIPAGQNELHKKVLETLSEDFKDIRKAKQFGVMYMHPPNMNIGTVVYSVDKPFPVINNDGVMIPPLTENNRNNFPFSYVATTPDFNGAKYGKMMNKPKGQNIHTEDLMLNLVYRGMKNWYRNKFGTDVQHVYLYTFFLPCPSCTGYIQNFVKANPKVKLYVGFSYLLGGNKEFSDEALIKQRIQESKDRNKNLKNFLNNNNGGLYRLYFKCNRRKRSANEACGVQETITELTLSMDFSTGKAQVILVSLPNNSNGWIGLYDKDDREIERQYQRNSTGIITFSSLMNENYSAKYLKDERNVYIETGKWNQCGFDWVNLNKIPCRYGMLMIRVQIQDGAPYVCLRHSGNWVANSNDWLMAQPLVNFTSNQRGRNWQSISSFSSAGANTVCKKLAQFDSTFVEGFRVKYVYNNGTDQYEGPYDNSSPVWIQSECSVSSVRHIMDNKANPTSGTKRTGANMIIIMVAILVLALLNSNI